MCKIVGIRFRPCGKIHFYDPGEIELNKNDRVVVEGDMGLTLGRVVLGTKELQPSEKSFKMIIRTATKEDFEQKRENDILIKDAADFCMNRIQQRELPMKFIEAESTLDRRRIIFYFTAEGRVDFRKLVRDLASRFRTRIEMRQIGVRDEVKFLGGIGPCGREVCCKLFLFNFEPISIKMAKKQELVLSPSKLSGLCGRLRCCIAYEDMERGNECHCPAMDDGIYGDINSVIKISDDRKTTVTSYTEDSENKKDRRRRKRQKKRS